MKDQAISKSCWKNGDETSSQKHVLKTIFFIPVVNLWEIVKRLLCSYSTVRDSMEDDLHTGTPYRISCLRQQPSGVDRRCQIWPIRGYTRFWYTVVSFLKLISQAFPRLLPQSPLVFFRSFARAPLSECLEQARYELSEKDHWCSKCVISISATVTLFRASVSRVER